MTDVKGRSRRRLRILHIVQNLNYGGMERVLADIVRLASDSVLESHVLCLQFLGRYARDVENHAILHVAPPLGKLSMLWPACLIRQIRRIAPDVVHTHSGVWYKASLAARRAGVRHLVHTEHGRAHFDPLLHRLLDAVAARRTDVIVAVSDPLARYVSRALHIPLEQIRVVRNGVDTLSYCPRPDGGGVRRELGIPPETPVLGSIGRLEPVKGYDLMIRAFRILLEDFEIDPAPVLVIAGDGSQRTELERLARALKLGKEVHFLGWRDDVHELHATFTVFTLSSHSEGTSISLLEAMSAGLCPVLTDVGGNREVLGEELAHRLVPPADARSLARAWREALSQPSILKRDESAARRRVKTAFSVLGMVREYERIYAGRDEEPGASHHFLDDRFDLAPRSGPGGA